MAFIFEDEMGTDVVMRRVSSIIKEEHKLKIYTRMDSELNERPVSEFGEADKTYEKPLTELVDLIFQYGDRCTRLTADEFSSYLEAFCNRWSYKYGNLLLTEMQDYGMIDNYNKNSKITTEYEGREMNDTAYTGSAKHETEYAGSEKDTNIRTGSQALQHGMTSTNKVNGTNASNVLSTKDATENTGTDTTTFNNLKDEDTKTFTNRKDTTTDSFTDRSDNSTKSFDDRIDTVTEKTYGNIGVTTSAQMLESERELSNFSIWQIMFTDLVREISIML